MLKLVLKIFLLSFVMSLVGCSAQMMYTATIESERDDAYLEKKSIKLDFGEIIYLENSIKNDVTVVLLHGFGGNKDIWNRFSAALSEDNHIIVVDLPGHGKSISSKNLNYSISNQAEMLELFLAAKKIKKIHIIGNSMGGAIALKYTGQYADKVKSLTLVDALGMIKTKSEFVEEFERTGLNPFFDICTEVAFEKLMNFSMQKPPYIPGMMMGYLVNEKCARADIEKVIFNDMIKDSDLGVVAKNIKTPTLIIWGQKDRILHIDNAQLFHTTIKGSQLVIFKELGHVPLLEDPDKTAFVTEKFIKNIH
jgi:pimeloyl-ACP methyl ester carboxylesterase